MKWIFGFFSLFCIGSLFGAQTLMVDPYFSPYAGSSDLLLTEEFFIWGLDGATAKGTDKNTIRKVWGRTLGQLLFWTTIDELVTVTQHEVFGHGYRLRELGITPKGYQVTPWSGATYFHLPDSFPLGKLQAVVVAGLEAEGILARDLKMQWIGKGEIDGRLSTTYTGAEQSLFWYTLITQKGETSEGNDIANYIEINNASYGKRDLTIGKLTRWSIFNWLDPMTFYAYYAFFYYISTGEPWSFPMIPLRENLRYLPNVRIGYAPYAPEAYLENFFSINGKPLYFYLKGGKRSIGAGFGYDYFFTGARGSIGFRFDGWNQNVFISSATVEEFEKGEDVFRPVVNKRRWGVALSMRSYLNFSSNLALFVEIGGKTSGYLPGYSLGNVMVGRIGLTFGKDSLRQKIAPPSTLGVE